MKTIFTLFLFFLMSTFNVGQAGFLISESNSLEDDQSPQKKGMTLDLSKIAGEDSECQELANKCYRGEISVEKCKEAISIVVTKQIEDKIKAFLNANPSKANKVVAIKLSHNCLKKIPESVCLFKNLVTLDVSFNCIEAYPKGKLLLKNLVIHNNPCAEILEKKTSFKKKYPNIKLEACPPE